MVEPRGNKESRSSGRSVLNEGGSSGRRRSVRPATVPVSQWDLKPTPERYIDGVSHLEALDPVLIAIEVDAQAVEERENPQERDDDSDEDRNSSNDAHSPHEGMLRGLTHRGRAITEAHQFERRDRPSWQNYHMP